ENNNYAMGTSVARTSKTLDLVKTADAYEMPADVVDGMSPEEVHNALTRAVNRARENGGPTLLEIKTYRYKGHSMSDPQKYRTKEELEEYKEKDPIEHVLSVLKKAHKVPDDQIEAINERVKKTVDDSVTFSENSPWPDDNELLKDVYVQNDYPFIMD
ncbi:MAG: thiamine pyrophosphate-dependent enzyme, partial [Ferruginibacter sp.]